MLSIRHWLMAGVAALGLMAAAQTAAQDYRRDAPRHVLLISVDGMHEVDLRLWVLGHPNGTLAELSKRGDTYTQAYTTAPSDSFPGMIAQVTGGTPFSAGVFYDDSYDRTFYAPGSNCAGTPGAETTYAENLDYNLNDVTGGGTLGQPLTQIDPAKLPMTYRNGACVVVYPHEFIRVNTVFEVLRSHGLHTAWSDKHPAYEILSGPSGTGVEDLYTPEINAQVPGAPAGQDYTTSFNAVRGYDATKVAAVVNQIQGKLSTGQPSGYVPAIMGMNFQSVSVGQKLAISGFGDPDGLVGGYTDAASTPGNALTLQLQFIDDSMAAMANALKTQGIYGNTVVIVSAKHGQSPIDRSLRRAIPDSYSKVLANDAYGFNIADDASLIWLDPSQRTPATYQSAITDLKASATDLGIQKILGHAQLDKLYRNPLTDSRTPDIYVKSEKGVIYTGGTKLSEHGGLADDDRHVAMLVSADGLSGASVNARVATAQIAPTILSVLGISPYELQGVQIEGTRTLPRVPQGNYDYPRPVSPDFPN